MVVVLVVVLRQGDAVGKTAGQDGRSQYPAEQMGPCSDFHKSFSLDKPWQDAGESYYCSELCHSPRQSESLPATDSGAPAELGSSNELEENHSDDEILPRPRGGDRVTPR
jgi:hypothetical protein